MKIVRNSVLPFEGYKVLNLFGILFCRKDAVLNDWTLNHEAIHTAQMREMLYIPFYIWYGAEWVVRLFQYSDPHMAYRGISLEQEAYDHEGDMDYTENRKHLAWINYL